MSLLPRLIKHPGIGKGTVTRLLGLLFVPGMAEGCVEDVGRWWCEEDVGWWWCVEDEGQWWYVEDVGQWWYVEDVGRWWCVADVGQWWSVENVGWWWCVKDVDGGGVWRKMEGTYNYVDTGCTWWRYV